MKFQLYQPQAIHELGNRKNQEDSIYPVKGEATADDRLFLVCDGMGGHDKGEVASAAICKGMSEAMKEMMTDHSIIQDEQFESALTKAYDTLDAADEAHEGKMGSTMTFLCLHKGGCMVAHIGDSRIYHLRPQTNEVLYRSRDHSLVQQLYELGEISYNEMSTSPRKNIILKAMQPYQDERVKATIVHITDIREGDYFYLCSDGMLEEMEDDELMDIMKADTTDEEKAQELIRRTVGNADNHSAYLIRIKAVEHEEGDENLVNDEEEERRKSKALNDQNKNEAWDMGNDSDHQSTRMVAASSSKKKGKTGLIILAALLIIGIAVAAVLLLGGKKDATTPNEDEESNTTENISDMLHMEKDADMEESKEDQIPSAKPYLEKKAEDKNSPVEPDMLPESKPIIIQEQSGNAEDGSAKKSVN
jgi:protein phosphatase